MLKTQKDTSRMTIDLPADIKNQAKAYASLEGKKLNEYVTEALSEKIRRDAELDDKFCIQLAEEGEKSGYIGKKASEELVKKILSSNSRRAGK